MRINQHNAITEEMIERIEKAEKKLRICDIMIASCSLIIALPIMLLIIIAILIFDGRPIFFKQRRLKKNQKTFIIYKFRTMQIDAEKDAIKWAQPNDPRVTKIGRFLRKTGLDELPQIFNVLKGDMSCVGPRPIRKEFATLLTQYYPDYPKRFLVKPGITGYAQLYAPYGTTIEEQLKKVPYDQKYLTGLSISEYFKILFKTVLFVIKGRKW